MKSMTADHIHPARDNCGLIYPSVLWWMDVVGDIRLKPDVNGVPSLYRSEHGILRYHIRFTL